MEADFVRDHRKIEIVAEKKDKAKNKGPKRSVQTNEDILKNFSLCW